MSALRPAAYTPEQIIEALRKTKGLIGLAADELKCDRKTIYNHVKKSAAVRDALESVRERNLDVAESKLLGAIDTGESWAITYYLSRIGRERGYGDRNELTGLNGGALVIRLTWGDSGDPTDSV